MDRKQLREKALSSSRGKKLVVDVFGGQVEVRQPTIGVIVDSGSPEHIKHALAFMIVSCCYVPETGEKLFDMTDIDSLRDVPFDEDMQKLSKAFTELSGVNVDEAIKNSAGSPSVSTS